MESKEKRKCTEYQKLVAKAIELINHPKGNEQDKKELQDALEIYCEVYEKQTGEESKLD